MSKFTSAVTWDELHDDNKFGEFSQSDVVKVDGTYAIVRECDNKELLRGDSLKEYEDDIIRIMYTGICHGSGEYLLYSDRHGVIYRWVENNDYKA